MDNNNLSLSKIVGFANLPTIPFPSVAIILQTVDNPPKQLPIVIGTFEATAISMHLNSVKTSRPLTYDLFSNILAETNTTIDHITITELKNDIFFASISFHNTIDNFDMDARPSDALALAVRANCPIYVTTDLFKSTSIISTISQQPDPQLPDPVAAPPESNTDYFDTYTNIREADNYLETLNDKLNKAIAKEDYELAAHIRDFINEYNKPKEKFTTPIDKPKRKPRKPKA